MTESTALWNTTQLRSALKRNLQIVPHLVG